MSSRNISNCCKTKKQNKLFSYRLSKKQMFFCCGSPVLDFNDVAAYFENVRIRQQITDLRFRWKEVNRIKMTINSF